LLKEGALVTGEIKMKKIIAFVAFICALGGFAGLPSADVSSHAVLETLSPMAMAQESRSLPIEAYDAI
jgi:hypothetical protein